MGLPLALVRVGSNVIPAILGANGSAVDLDGTLYENVSLEGVLTLDPVSVFYGVQLEAAEQSGLRMAAEAVHVDTSDALGRTEGPAWLVPQRDPVAERDRELAARSKVHGDARALLRSFVNTFLISVEKSEEDYQSDPRLEQIASAIEAHVKSDIVAVYYDPNEPTILGGGSFGVASVLADGRVIKLTTDPTEVAAGALLVGKNLPHVVRIDHAWFIRGVHVTAQLGWDAFKDEPIERQARVGLLIEEKVTVCDPSDGALRSVSTAVQRLKQDNQAFPSQLMKLTKERQRTKLFALSTELEGELRQMAAHRGPMGLIHDVANALQELREIGIYAIDVHGGNLGYVEFTGARGRVYKIFDVGVGSTPETAQKPKTIVGDKKRPPVLAGTFAQVHERALENIAEISGASSTSGAREARVYKLKPRGQLFHPVEGLVSGYPMVRAQLLRHRAEVPTVDTIRASAVFAGGSIMVGTAQAEKSFACIEKKFYAAGNKFVPLAEIKECIASLGLHKIRQGLYVESGPWAQVIQNAMRGGMRDRELRRYALFHTSLPPTLSITKVSFTLALLGQNLVCLDTRLLTRMFKSDQTKIKEVERSFSHGNMLSLARYEALEDAFLAGNAFYDPSDPIGRARAQWQAWEASPSRPGEAPKPATHAPWLRLVTTQNANESVMEVAREMAEEARFPNKFPAPCRVCGTRVPAHAGITPGPPWVTICKPCLDKHAPAPGALPAAPPAKPGVSVTPDPYGAEIKPIGYLGGDLFGAYRAAVATAKYDPSRRVQLARVDQLPGILDALQRAGFELRVDPSLKIDVQKFASVVRHEVSAANNRAEIIDAQLKLRGMSLYPFQRQGVAWLAPRRSALLADDMGLGKTIQALAALPAAAPVLVVSPAVAKGVWLREVASWRPEYKPEVLSGRGSFRWPSAGEIVITNYDILPDEAGPPPRGVVLIADEAHALKGSKTARTKKFRALGDAVLTSGGRVWLLTATPLLNTPPELWSILQAAQLTREAFGNWDRFVDLFGGYQGAYGMEWSGNVKPEAALGLKKVSIRRMKVDVLPELPVKTWNEIYVTLKPKDSKAADAALKALAKKGIDLDVVIEKAAAQANAALGFQEISAARAILATAKMTAMEEVIEEFEENKEPLVVFSAHRAPIDALEGRPGWAVITGDTPPEKRTEIENKFQRGELRGVGATIKAGGVAITLTRASHALFVDLDWTPALNAQAEDRICRIGQTRGCIITTLVADHILDKRIYALLSVKRSLIAQTIDAGARFDSVKPELVDVDKINFGTLYIPVEREARAARQVRVPPPGFFRAARTPLEEWAARGLQIVAGNDPDYARVKNEVGFNAADGGVGHSLVSQLPLLSDGQWALATKLAQKYRRQIPDARPAA